MLPALAATGKQMSQRKMIVQGAMLLPKICTEDEVIQRPLIHFGSKIGLWIGPGEYPLSFVTRQMTIKKRPVGVVIQTSCRRKHLGYRMFRLRVALNAI
jgi:hypothetical protein